MRAIIIDDDFWNIELISNFCKAYAPDVEIVGTATDVDLGIQEIVHKKPDLLFLDIELDNKTGFDILDAIDASKLIVIMVTAHEKYAVRAFNARAFHYLLKPLSITEFSNAIIFAKQKYEELGILEAFKNGQATQELHDPRFIQIIEASHSTLVAIDEVVRLESQNNCTLVKSLKGNVYASTKPLIYYEERLPAQDFIRTHKSHIINIGEVSAETDQSSGSIRLLNGDIVPVSERRRKEVFERLFI